jgi:hypothetical protein
MNNFSYGELDFVMISRNLSTDLWYGLTLALLVSIYLISAGRLCINSAFSVIYCLNPELTISLCSIWTLVLMGALI